MYQILKSPGKYVQGPGVLSQLDRHLQGMGNRLLVVLSRSGSGRVGPTLDRCFRETDYQLRYEIFQGECSQRQIDRLAALAREEGSTAIVGIGGGKILDTAKAAAHYTGLPAVIVPTVASTDAPCSSLSVIYRDNGEFERYLFLNTCPNMVVVDTDIIIRSPAKLLAAGMGDALATWFEARACRASGSNNQVGARPTRTATGLASMCWDHLRRYGVKAMRDAEAGLLTEAVETIVEVNTYLSSVGFESGGLAAAHAIQKGFTFIPQLHDLYHGNKVAFCTLVQLVMERAPREEIEAVLDFCCAVGLPVCFADMGYDTPDQELLKKAAEKACVPGSTIHNMPFAVMPEMVYQGLLEADRLGAARRGLS